MVAAIHLWPVNLHRLHLYLRLFSKPILVADTRYWVLRDLWRVGYLGLARHSPEHFRLIKRQEITWKLSSSNIGTVGRQDDLPYGYPGSGGPGVATGFGCECPAATCLRGRAVGNGNGNRPVSGATRLLSGSFGGRLKRSHPARDISDAFTSCRGSPAGLGGDPGWAGNGKHVNPSSRCRTVG